MERQPRAYHALLGLTLCFSILAVITLIPNAAASKPNVLGYRSVCTFAPAATALCALLAGTTCVIRSRLVSSKKATNRFRPPFVAASVGLILLGLFIGGLASFTRAQRSFRGVIDSSRPAVAATLTVADGRHRGRVAEGEVSATVVVSVAGGRLESITLEEGTNVESTVADTMFRQVIEAQNTAVDAVSGATATSQVLLRAIEQALGVTPSP